MKTKRILPTLSLGYGINMMGFESSLTRTNLCQQSGTHCFVPPGVLYAVQGEPAPHG